MSELVAPDGVRLTYDVRGEGPVVVLLHGFASNARINWERPGVVDALVDAGHRVVTYDARGHGRSDAPHDPAAYSGGAMVGDARALLDALDTDLVDLVGYSMGAQVAAGVAMVEPRVRRLVLGGIGTRLLARRAEEIAYPANDIADALEAPDSAAISNPTARAFRSFADATKADRLALAALQRSRSVGGRVDLACITMPVLVVVGEQDTLVGDGGGLAAQLPDGHLVVVPGDHISAVTRAEFAAALVRFLAPDS